MPEPRSLAADVDFAVQPVSMPAFLSVDVDFALQGIGPFSEWSVMAVDTDFQVELDVNQSLRAMKLGDEIVLAPAYCKVEGALVDLVSGEVLA